MYRIAFLGSSSFEVDGKKLLPECGMLVKQRNRLEPKSASQGLAGFALAVGALATYGYGMHSEAENKLQVKAEALTWR